MSRQQLVLVLVLGSLSAAQDYPYDLQEIPIGGIFEEVNGVEEKAFLLAVDFVNRNQLVSGKTLVPYVSYISYFDSFQAQKKVCSLVKKGSVAVLGPKSSLTTHHVQSLCDSLEVPHITTRWDPEQKRSSCLVNLYPHPKTISKALRDVVDAWDWKGFTVLYDDFDALLKIDGLVKMADQSGYLVTVRQLEKHPIFSYRSLLKEIKFSGELNLVIECSTDKIVQLLMEAQQVGLMGPDYNYIIPNLDFLTINYEPFTHSGTNITALRLVNMNSSYVQDIYKSFTETTTMRLNEEYETDYSEEKQRDQAKTNEENNRESRVDEEFAKNGNNKISETNSNVTLHQPTLQEALIFDAIFLLSKALNHLTIKPKYMDCNDNTNLDFGYTIINFMRLSEFQGMTGLVKFDYEGFRKEISLEIVEVTEDGLNLRGFWNDSVQLIHPEPGEAVVGHNEDLSNTTFVVLIALTHPYNMLKESKEPLVGNDRYEGYGVDLIQELSKMSGFNYTLKQHTDKNSGNPVRLKNGTVIWDGLIGEVLAGRADLAIADITITRERERDADFTDPFMNLGISILHRKPTKAAPSLFSFLSPFSSEVWAYMMSAYVGVSLLLFVMARISPFEWTNPYPCVSDPHILENQFSLNNSFWFTVGSLMQQGSDIAPIAPSTRMVASFWWFFTLIMVSSYTAQLASFLTIEGTVQPFSDIEELANQNIIKYGAKVNGSTANFFRDSQNPTHQRIYQFMKNHPDCMMSSNEEGVERVLREKNYAFFMESTSIEYEVERKCDLAQVGGLLDHKGYGLVMRQNSTYRNILSRNVVNLQEKGKLTQLKNKWWQQKRGGGACMKKGQAGEASKLSLENTGGVFVVLLAGCTFATLLSFGELLWEVYNREGKVSFEKELKEEIRFISQCRGRVKKVQNTSLEESSNSFEKNSYSVSKSSSIS